MHPTLSRELYWRKTLKVSGLLLAAWFAVTFVLGWFARDLDFDVLGWPFSFWMCAQGALVVYVAITWYYARYMNRLDELYMGAQREH